MNDLFQHEPLIAELRKKSYNLANKSEEYIQLFSQFKDNKEFSVEMDIKLLEMIGAFQEISKIHHKLFNKTQERETYDY